MWLKGPSSEASFPAAHKTVAAWIRSSPKSTPWASTFVTTEDVQICTPSFSKSRAAWLASFSENIGKIRGPASTRITRVSRGLIRRKSLAKVNRLISPMAPANSTPVGPPPTITNVRQLFCSSMLSTRSAQFKRQEHPPADFRGLGHRLQTRRVLFPFLMPKITMGRPAGDHQILVRHFPDVKCHEGPLKLNPQRRALQHADVFEMRKDAANGRGDVRRTQTRRRHLIQQRLKQMMVLPVHQRDVHIPFVAQDFGGVQPGKPSADNQNVSAHSG